MSKDKTDKTDRRAEGSRGAVAFGAWVERQRRDGRQYVDIERSLGLSAGAAMRWSKGVNLPLKATRVLLEHVASIPAAWWEEAVERPMPIQQPAAPEQQPVNNEDILREILNAIRVSNELLRQILAPPMPSSKANGAPTREHPAL